MKGLSRIGGFLKKLFKRKLFLFFLFFFLVYHAIFNSYTASKLIPSVFASISTGSLQGDFQTFSLLYGIEITNLKIFSGEDFANKELITTDRLALLYSIPKLFTGRLEISEVSLESAKIYMLKKKGKWNVETLFPPGKPTPKPKEESKPLEKLDTYIPVSAGALFKISNLQFTMEDRESKNPLFLQTKDISLRFQLNTHSSSSIPLNLDALSLLDILKIELNPKKPISIVFQNSGYELKEKLNATLLLHKEPSQKSLRFYSKLDLGADKISPKIEGKALEPFQLQAGYELKYQPKKDLLVLDYLHILFQKKVWLKITGKLTDLLKNKRNLDLKIEKSAIFLEPVANILNKIPGVGKMRFGGELKLAPSSAKGSLKKLAVDVNINGKRLFFDKHRVRSLKLQGETTLDLQSKAKPSPQNPLPLLQSLNLQKLELVYNNIFASLNGTVKENRNTKLKLTLRNLYLQSYVKDLKGLLGADLNVSGKDLSALTASLSAKLSRFSFKIGKSKSGVSSFRLTSKLGISFYKPWIPDLVKLPNLQINMFNADSNKALSLTILKSSLGLKDGLDAKVNSLEIKSYLSNLLLAFPLSLRETIVPFRNMIGAEQTVQVKANYKNSPTKDRLNGNVLVRVPALKVDDLVTNFDMQIGKTGTQKIDFKTFTLSAMKGKFTGFVKGDLQKKGKKGEPAPLGDYYPNLKVNLSLISEKFKTLLAKVKYQGKLKIDLDLLDFLVTGSVISQKSNVEVTQGNCESEEGCSKIQLQQLEMNLPIKHNLGLKRTESLVQGNKAKYVRPYGGIEKTNFSIQAIYGPHPSNKKRQFPYMIRQNGKLPGLSARIDYKENYFAMNDLRIHTLGGTIYGKDILFNVGRGKKEEMEYAAVLQVKDVDLKEMLPEKTKKRFDEGEIKADMNIQGGNLSDPLNNLKLFFSIYQIGEDFGKSAINIISPENVLRDWVVGNYKVDKVEVELSKGLVYANILFQRSILSSLLVKIKDNKISQERIPLANFLKRAKSEISTYQ
ncbi:MAG: hypothetical protein AAF518_04675 [Spirochaetota bacterium]